MSATSKGGLYAVCGSFIALSTTAISLCFFSRKYQKLPLGLDDWTALFAVITYIPSAALAIHIAVWDVGGYGNPTAAQLAAKFETYVHIAFAYDFLNQNTLACAKLSALFLYKRIFVVSGRSWFNRVIWATVVVIILWYIFSDFLSLYQCPGHFSAIYDGQFAKYCYLDPVWAKEIAITDFILDVWVLVLPIAPIMRLHVTLAKKLSIFGVFLLAFVGLGASIARIVYYVQFHGSSRAVIYIAMLEEGISATVVNLPSIYYVCTSVIPSRIADSLHSLRSFVSSNSLESRSRCSVSNAAKDSGPGNAPIATLAVPEKSAWRSQWSSVAPDNRYDIEARPDSYDHGDSDDYPRG